MKNKLKSIRLPELEGKTCQEAYDYLLKSEYKDCLAKKEDMESNDASELKDGEWQHFFGSVFRNSFGRWSVPYVRWNGSSFEASGGWLGIRWRSDCRVVVLETCPLPSDTGSARFDPLSFAKSVSALVPVLTISISGGTEELILKSEVKRLLETLN